MKTRFTKITLPSLFLGLGAIILGYVSPHDVQAAAEKSITIATSADPRPFTYFDKDNQLTGYDIDVAKAIFNNLPQYKVSFVTTEFTSILAGLDADRFQLGANNFAENPERKEKYLFSQPIFENQFVIATPEKNNTIKTFNDLLGKSTEVNPGVNFTTALEKFNQQHKDNPVKLQYTEADLLISLQNLENGKTDFVLIDKSMLEQYVQEHHLKLNIIPLNKEDSQRIGSPYSYFLIAKGKAGEQLLNNINDQIKKLSADGTLSKISEKYFNGDYAPK
ncbi:Arginine ABC transporter, periplasmic arginine-binding protein ArtJ [Pectobacterium sp. F1-1]|uniref:transporter substrate-binding domain-containing protein n=1 Tax=Pectobacterium sp. F1-1 TaxID=2949614 RepID=UPI0021D7A0A4|nr:transporter substrate-binding domain-containing protein [Pectobacterium sp. F1-1]UYA62356.1 Arginine ABC transporter, periplasmic arginine-binding protein ArtJ [Pectobacterium sp. F1-1]